MENIIDEALAKLGEDIASQQEELIMQALRENGYKVDNPKTIARRATIQVDLENKNKRVLFDGKLILVMSTDYNIVLTEEGLKVNFGYKIIKGVK